ncbi:MAG TPA: carotenoid oxygenase family protein [Polyangiales bacterium]|nr:carotenoid oxygenase family protein [Polyangiales bacterium]
MRDIYEAVYRSQPEEHASAALSISGAVPADLKGTFLRNGPGLMQLGDDAYLNFLDGHALIVGVTFADGRARFRSRYVRTPLYAAETAQHTVLARRPFTNRPQRWTNLFALKFGNSVMHDVYAWGDGEQRRVVAGNDFGHFALDPRTLATLGPETWSGAAPEGKSEMGPMPYPDPHTGRLIAWLKQPGGLKPDALAFVEIDAAFRVAKRTPFWPLAAAPAIVHDQRASAGWYIATEQALRLKPAQAIWGASTAYDALVTPPGGTATLLLASRSDPTALIRVPLPAPIQVAFHILNAFDQGAHVVVDLVTYGGRVGFEAAAPRPLRERTGHAPSDGPLPTPVRFVVDPARGQVVETRKLSDLPGEAPEVADSVMGKPYRYAYVPTSNGADLPDRGAYFYFGALAKLDVESGASEVWNAGSDALVSPCAFVQRPAAASEDDGWLLAYVLREPSTQVVILDARALTRGPVATLDLGVHLPGTSHVRWAPDVALD